MLAPNPVTTTIRSAKRANQILVVLVRLGFDDLVHDLGLVKVLDEGRRMLGRERPAAEIKRQPPTVRIRQAMEELGPTFIKVGQILSTRPDLVPNEYAQEFAKLQSSVPPVPWSEIKAVLDAEFPAGIETVFARIEPEPLAAASMAQVHRAVLTSGQEVVVKVLRPGIAEIIESDLEIMKAFAELTRNYFVQRGFDPVAVTDQFGKELRRELDLMLEGRSTERMGRDFADNENVTFPKVYWEGTTRSVLTLEEIHGTLLNQVDPQALTREQRHRIVANGADAVFRQCLIIGFFHADPHPGNMFLLPGERLCFIDCGMTGYLDPTTSEKLAVLVHAVVAGDLEQVIKAAIQLAGADPAMASQRQFRADVWRYIDKFRVESISELQMGPLLGEFFDVLRAHHVQCPADLVHLIKAIGTIEGVADAIAPDFDLVTYARPYVEQLVKRRYGFEALKHRFESALMGYTDLVEQLPGNLQDMFTAIQQKRLSLNLEVKGLERLTQIIDSASLNISSALVIAALIVGSSVLVLAGGRADQPGWINVFAVIGFVLAVLIIGMRLVAHYFEWRRK